MKKVFLCFVFSSFTLFALAQSSLHQNVKKLLAETHPEINLDNKLIALNVWSLDNLESREANKSFEKTYGVYEYGRLKGGIKGVVAVAVSKDNLSGDAVITFTRDGISKMISVKLSEITGIDAGLSNIVFDSAGNEIYRNLHASAVYNAFQHLVTR